MRLVWLAVFLTVSLILAPLAAAQRPAQTGKVYRVGSLNPPTRKSSEHLVQAFEQEISRLGWVLGQDLAIEYRWAEGRYERLPALAAELVQLKVDVIIASTTPAILAAQKATSSIPIVMVQGPDPVASGFARSFAQPGGNITGTTSLAGWETVGKRLQLLKEAVPQVSRVAVLGNPANPSYQLALTEVRTAASSLNFERQLLRARGPEEFDSAFAAMKREHAGALLVLGDAMFFAHRARLVELATMSRLPTMFAQKEPVEAGGLMAYVTDFADSLRRAAGYVDISKHAGRVNDESILVDEIAV